MKVGFPRALMYYYFYPLWRTLFESLGIEVVVSDKTTKGLLQKGIVITVPEICLPIKIFNAHVINVLEKDIDYIFVPRFISMEKDMWFCPKYIGLPEIVMNSVSGAEDKLLTMDVDINDDSLSNIKSYLPLCEKLNVTKADMKKALEKGLAMFKKFRELCKAGMTIDEADILCYDDTKIKKFSETKKEINIGLLGYVYIVYDKFISMDIIGKLRDMGVNVITFEMMDENELKKQRIKGKKQIYWTFSDRLYQTAKNLAEQNKVDGLIHITAFGCGPDSITGRMVELDCENYEKPFMTIRVDEHTGESHLLTRIEAFVDMIKRNKDNKSEIKVNKGE